MYLNKQEKYGTAPDVSLNQAEIRCLSLAAEGLDTGHIGRITGLDDTVVNDILDAARRKLGAHNRLHAVSIAIIEGIVGSGSR